MAYKYAQLHDGNQCYGSMHYGSESTNDLSECSTPCTHYEDTEKICGSSTNMSVWSLDRRDDEALMHDEYQKNPGKCRRKTDDGFEQIDYEIQTDLMASVNVYECQAKCN